MSKPMTPARVHRIYWRVLFTLGALALVVASVGLILSVIDHDALGAATLGFFLGIFSMKMANDYGKFLREKHGSVERPRKRRRRAPATLREISARAGKMVKR